MFAIKPIIKGFGRTKLLPETAAAPVATGRSRLSLFAVEPRMLFDGAAVATVDAVHHTPAPADAAASRDNGAAPAADHRGLDAKIAHGAISTVQNGGADSPAQNNEKWIGSNDKVQDGNVFDPGSGNHYDHSKVVGVAAGDNGQPAQGNVGRAVTGQYGTLTVYADGWYAYEVNNNGRNVPAGNTVQDCFTYTIDNGSGSLSSAKVTVDLTGDTHASADASGNHNPTGVANSRDVSVGGKITDGQVLISDGHGNTPDSDIDGDALVVTGVAAGAQSDVARTGLGQDIHGTYGTLVLNADGSYTYTPDAGVSIPAGQTAQDTFSYKLCDNVGGEAIATINIALHGDGASSGGDHAPVAVDHVRSTTPTQAVTDGKVLQADGHGNAADFDVDGDALTITGVTSGTTSDVARQGLGQPIHGAYGDLVMNADGSYTYTPRSGVSVPTGQTLTDTFSYKLCDNAGGEAIGHVTVALSAQGDTGSGGDAGGNHAPQQVDHVRTITTNESVQDGSVLHADGHGNGGDYDLDGDALIVTGVTTTSTSIVPRSGLGQPIHGAYGDLVMNADGTYTYTPRAGVTVPSGQTVTDEFSYKLCDNNGGESAGHISIVISGDANGNGGGNNGGNGGGNGAGPQANADDFYIRNIDYISDGQAIAGYHNPDFLVHQDNADVGNGLHVVGVTPGNTGTDVLNSQVGQATFGAYGALVLRTDGSYTYTVGDGKAIPAGTSQNDVFTYTVADQNGQLATTTITIHIEGVDQSAAGSGNHAPQQVDHVRTITPSETVQDGKVLQADGHGNGGDYDLDGDTLTVTGVTTGSTSDVPRAGLGQPIHGDYGDLVMNADGSYTYTPRAGVTVPAGQTVTDDFSYKLCDNNGGESAGHINIVINGDGSVAAPKANPDEYFITSTGSVTDGKALTGFHNPDMGWHQDNADVGTGLHVVGVTNGDTGSNVSGHVGQPVAGNLGSLTLNPDGTYTYTTNDAGKAVPRGTTQNDVFTYTVADQNGQLATTTITIHIIGNGNNAPESVNHVRDLTPGQSVSDGKVLQPDGHGNGADFDKDGDALHVTGVTSGSTTAVPRDGVGNVIQGTYGDLVINADGTYTYTPHAGVTVPAGQTVTDTFSYMLCDDHGGEGTGTIVINTRGDNPGGGGTNPGGGGTNPGGGGTNPGGGGDNPGGGGTNPGGGGTNPGGGGTNPGGGGSNPGGGGDNPGGGGTNPGGGGTNPGGGGTNPGGGGTNPGGGGANPGGGTNPGGGGSSNNGGGGGGGSGGNAGPALPPVPAGFDNPALSGAGGPTPRYSEVTTKPLTEAPLVLPPDQSGPFVFEKVKGVVEEAPVEGDGLAKGPVDPVLLAAATKPVRPTDDCVPQVKTAHKAVAKPKPTVVSSSIFAKPDVVGAGVPKTFSEQVKTAGKRLPVHHKVAPLRAPTEKGC